MKTHEVIWYESEDGHMFTDQDECLEHEAKLLYHESGVRFYNVDWKPVEFITKDDWTYNNTYYMVFDRAKEKETRLLVDCLYYNFGWCLVKEAFNTDGDTFILKMNKAYPVSSHLVY